MTDAERAVIEAAKAWAESPTDLPVSEVLRRFAALEADLAKAVATLNAAPEPTAAERAEAVRRELADEEVREAMLSWVKSRPGVSSLMVLEFLDAVCLMQEGRDDG